MHREVARHSATRLYCLPAHGACALNDVDGALAHVSCAVLGTITGARGGPGDTVAAAAARCRVGRGAGSVPSPGMPCLRVATALAAHTLARCCLRVGTALLWRQEVTYLHMLCCFLNCPLKQQGCARESVHTCSTSTRVASRQARGVRGSAQSVRCARHKCDACTQSNAKLLHEAVHVQHACHTAQHATAWCWHKQEDTHRPLGFVLC